MSTQTKLPNAFQINTVRTLLEQAINKKAEEIAEKTFEKDIKIFNNDMLHLGKMAHTLKQALISFKKKVEKKNNKLEIDEDHYGSLGYKLPKSIEDTKNNESLIKANGKCYGDYYGNYKPELAKERKEANDFVLGLTLGTALMSDLQVLLDKIDAIK